VENDPMSEFKEDDMTYHNLHVLSVVYLGLG
jgi:hypothetical protein